MSQDAISLYELNLKIRGVVQESFSGSLWVRAEVAELRENRNGHCYMDLVEKDEATDQVIARMKAMVWSYTYRMLKPYFETSAGRPLSKGIKILVKGNVEFQELYGMSLIVRDIDPAYTLGDLEQKRREVLKRLESEGVIHMNKELELPGVPQRIAIISSPTAAGYGDFLHQLKNNPYGIVFYCRLFPSVMQGEQASASVIQSLDTVFKHSHLFDIVVIIRGGGASLDLLCFDDYWLANHIAQFPLPVITGIGHERDLSVADMVAHTKLKTPTAVAEFLISGAWQILEKMNEYSVDMDSVVKNTLRNHQQKLERLSFTMLTDVKAAIKDRQHQLVRLSERLPSKTNALLVNQRMFLNQTIKSLGQLSGSAIQEKKRQIDRLKEQTITRAALLFKNQKVKLGYLDQNNRLHDPVNILQRGFSITRHLGKVIKSSENLEAGQVLETKFFKGEIQSLVKK